MRATERRPRWGVMVRRVARLRYLLPAIALIAGTFLALRAARPAQAAVLCFPATGQCIAGRFLDYWLAHGGLAQQGYPITGEFIELSATNGQAYVVQYFERARFEYHPENQPPFDVLLGQLGRDQLIARYGNDRRRGDVDCASPAGSSRTICDAFLAYWRANGGQAQYGVDLTFLINETNPVTGRSYLVQYYERARFEYHPEAAGTPFEVQLGLIGRERFLATYPQGVPSDAPPLPTAPTARPPLPPIPGLPATPTVRPTPIPGE